MLLFELRHKAKHLSLYQVRDIKKHAVQSRSENNGAVSDDDMQNVSSSALLLEESSLEEQSDPDSFSDIPHQQFQSAQLLPTALSNEDAHTQKGS